MGNAVINNGVRFRKRGETIALGRMEGSACLSAVLTSRLGYFWAREERRRTAGVTVKAELAPGGRGVGWAGCQWAESGA